MKVMLAAAINHLHFIALPRQFSGTSLSCFIVKQLLVFPLDAYHKKASFNDAALTAWISQRVLELTYTAHDLQPFAEDCGYTGPPFKWDSHRRFLIRCELDAAYFHLYGIDRDDVDYIMETFPIVKRKDETAHGEYRTKRVILEMYDAMAEAMRTGEPYQTPLDPPPGDRRASH